MVEQSKSQAQLEAKDKSDATCCTAWNVRSSTPDQTSEHESVGFNGRMPREEARSCQLNRADGSHWQRRAELQVFVN